MQKTLIFLAGCFVGGLIGGLAGYVINDLTERENPVVMQEIAEEQAQQDEFEDFLDQLAATPPPSSAPQTPPPSSAPPTSAPSEQPDSAGSSQPPSPVDGAADQPE